MTISVLATKCRFCGEEVGRPKDEARELTSADLGGETIFHRAPSGSVMEALESFRVEENTTVEPDRRKGKRRSSIWKRGGEEADSSTSSSSFDSDPGLPDLDQVSRGLAELSKDSLDSSFQSPNQAGNRKTTWVQRLVPMGGIALGLILALFLGMKGVTWARDYLASRDDAATPEYVNRAPSLIRNGAPPIDVLEAAQDAVNQADTDKNRAIREDALQLVVDRVYELLNTRDWSMETISEASTLASRAMSIYPTKVTQKLVDEARSDFNAYRMFILESVDVNEDNPDEATATFRVTRRGAGTVTVKVAPSGAPPEDPQYYLGAGILDEDTSKSRFIVTRAFGNTAKVKDLRRNGRTLTFKVGEPNPGH